MGTTAPWEKIRLAAVTATDSRPAKTMTLPYIELLTALRILDPLPAWVSGSDHLRGLDQAPKHYLADPVLAARLVKRNASQLLAGDAPHTVVPRDGGYLGSLFEFLAALSVRVFAQSCDAEVSHLRTDDSASGLDGIAAVCFISFGVGLHDEEPYGKSAHLV